MKQDHVLLEEEEERRRPGSIDELGGRRVNGGELDNNNRRAGITICNTITCRCKQQCVSNQMAMRDSQTVSYLLKPSQASYAFTF